MPHGRLLLVGSVLFVSFLMSGCSQELDASSPTVPSGLSALPSSSSESRFSEDDVMKLLIDYEAAFHQMTANPHVDVSIVRPYVTDEQLESDRAGLERLRAKGLSLVGNSRFEDLLVLSEGPRGPQQILVCEDITDVRVLDSLATDVTPQSRSNRSPMVVDLETGDSGLVVGRYETWDGDSNCGAE